MSKKNPSRGDKVRIKVHIPYLEHRKNKNGIITRRDGQYLYVRPMWCKYKLELYPCEVEVIN